MCFDLLNNTLIKFCKCLIFIITRNRNVEYIKVYFEDSAGESPPWQVPGIKMTDVVAESSYEKQLNIEDFVEGLRNIA